MGLQETASLEDDSVGCWSLRRLSHSQVSIPVPTASSAGTFIRTHLATTSPLPPITIGNWFKEVIWFNIFVIIVTPLLSLYGIWTTAFHSKTLTLCAVYYLWNMLGITAGYHRLWSHRAYNAILPLQYFLAIAGVGAVQGSIMWWSRQHRAHHRYTDTDLDPYGAHHGIWWSHLGWMLVKPRVQTRPVDISDLKKNVVVRWQHRWFFLLTFGFGLALPATIAGYFWNDWRGGIFFAGFLRLTWVHHSVFCVNSLAHWLGEATFDDKLSPRDHLVTAIITLGEGYHNFHHQFPMDYRNAVKWYQWDPTKWFIAACSSIGLATHLRKFPDVEIKRSALTMQLKKLKEDHETIPWPVPSDELPIINWETFQTQSRNRDLILISGFIHDVSLFMDGHPGGRRLLENHVGKDATTAFFGGVYDHSNAAHNYLTTMRVGALHGGLELMHETAIPPCLKLRIVQWPA